MKIYTKTGDQGETGLIGGARIPKSHLRIKSYGAIDELNSWLGLLRDQNIAPNHVTQLVAIQEKLFTIGAILATDPENLPIKKHRYLKKTPKLLAKDISVLENTIDELNTDLTPMTHFILPGGHQTVSYCHIARTVCRRAERGACELNDMQGIDPKVLVFLNRLSDYLFVLARKLSAELGVKEVKWIPEKEY